MSRSRLSQGSSQETRVTTASSPSSRSTTSNRLSWRSQSQPPFGDLNHDTGTLFDRHSPVFLSTESTQQMNRAGTGTARANENHNSRTISYPTRLRSSLMNTTRNSNRPRLSTSRRTLRALRFQGNSDAGLSSSSSNGSLTERCRPISEIAGTEPLSEPSESETNPPSVFRFSSPRLVTSNDTEQPLDQAVPLAMREGSCELDEFPTLPVRSNTEQTVPHLGSSGVLIPSLRQMRSRPVSDGAVNDLLVENYSRSSVVGTDPAGDDQAASPSPEISNSPSSIPPSVTENFLHPISMERQVLEVRSLNTAQSSPVIVRFPPRDSKARTRKGGSTNLPESDHDYYRAANFRSPYRSNEQLQKVMNGVNDLRQNGLFCDVILQAGSTKIPAHRNILASSSQYFHAMFTGPMAEARSACIKIHDVDGAALSQLIDFIYTGEICVTEDNVQALLPAANLFQLASVRDACCDFLQSQLHPSNCLGIQRFADLHDCPDLLVTSRRFTEQHFGELLDQNEEFLTLTVDQLVQLISSDHLAVSEDRVFEAVLRWIAYDVEQRQQFAPSLCSRVRFSLLPRDYLVRLSQSDNFLAVNPWCKDYLIEALSYHLLSWEQKLQVDSERAKPRTPRGLPKVLVVFGGQSPKALRSVELFDFLTGSWIFDRGDQITQISSLDNMDNTLSGSVSRSQSPLHQTTTPPAVSTSAPHMPCIPELPTRKCRFGVAMVNGIAYLVGGFNGALRVRTVEIYNPLTNKWHNAAPMECRRATLGVTVLDEKIYAIGGFDGNSGLSSSEVLDTYTTNWRLIAPMSCRRSSVGAATLCGKIYAVGGYDGDSRRCLNSAECYDPTTNEWTRIANMTCRRSGCAVVVLDNRLYAIGGHDGPVVRNTVEMYAPEAGTWQRIGDMNVRRRNACAVVHDGCIYVIGGEEGNVNIASIEKYDPSTNTWTLLPERMGLGRSYAGVAMIDRHLLI